MKRRHLLHYSLSGLVSGLALPSRAADKWGADQGYPTGWGGQFSRLPEYRVGNYSGGFERMLPHKLIGASSSPSRLDVQPVKDFKYRWGLFSRTPEDYLNEWPTTGLLICRDSTVLHETYRHGRTQDMRLTSWSMAKSVTSLLLGICLDKKLIASYDDPADKYLPELTGTLHGGISLRNLSNMSSGADVNHERDNPTIYPSAFTTRTSSIARTVAAWNQRREEQGTRYNYNELCPLTLGMVIRRVTQTSLSAFAQSYLWQPMGAQASATWTTDSEGHEFNCIGFAATLRDWGRLGLLVANGGKGSEGPVVSGDWIRELTNWTDKDRQVRFGIASSAFGYKAHMWHNKPDGSRLYFNGHHGQRVIIDLPTRTVMAHTAVDHAGPWQAELFQMFEAATKL